ncbi:MAG: COX15/CtaA family protein [Methylococcales bacterium]
MSDSHLVRRFRRLGILTVFAVYFLILVGGIVRASGAGMGCPDWPTCFGQWVPPTNESQLPTNYNEIYADLGYANTAFNPVKTWTEYLNRLTGVTIGFLIFLTVIYARPFLKDDKTVFYVALSAFLLVGFQGWLGSAVVASNLMPAMITVHMLVALIIVALLIYDIARSQKKTLQKIDSSGIPDIVRIVLIVAMAITLLQVVLGTQVREAVDTIAQAHQFGDRHLWRDELPIIFYVHRSFSIAVLLINLWLTWRIIGVVNRGSLLSSSTLSLISLIVIAIATGKVMDSFGIPAFVQPIHLFLATLIFGLQFFIYITLRYSADDFSVESLRS